MYRLILYYLELLLGVAFVLSFFGLLPFTPFSFLISTAIIVGVCWGVNTAFAFVFNAPTNVESACVAGGIGITPFRSMIKYLVDRDEKRDIALFYSNRTADETAYKELFDEAGARLGIKTIYAVTDGEISPWAYKGFITKEMIMGATPDYKERTFYISGPKVMVDAFRVTLKGMGVKSSKIKTDFFTGFA